MLAVGSAALDFALPGVDGKVHKLSDYKDSPDLMVMFLCDHCPTSQLYEGRAEKLVADDLVADYRDKGERRWRFSRMIRLSELGYTDVSYSASGNRW